MKHRNFSSLLFLGALLFHLINGFQATAQPTAIWNEGSDGDLSNNILLPPTDLGVLSTDITGQVSGGFSGIIGGDGIDFFVFEVPAGAKITSISFSSLGGDLRFAIREGANLLDTPFEEADNPNVGDELIDGSAPLDPGVYSIYLTRLQFSGMSYTLDFCIYTDPVAATDMTRTFCTGAVNTDRLLRVSLPGSPDDYEAVWIIGNNPAGLASGTEYGPSDNVDDVLFLSQTIRDAVRIENEAPNGTYNFDVKIRDRNTGCESDVLTGFSIEKLEAPAGTLGNTGPACTNENVFLTFTASAGSGPYEVQIAELASGNFTYGGPGNGAEIWTFQPGDLDPGDHTFTLTGIRDNNGCEITGLNQETTITIIAEPELDFVFNNPPSAYCPNANEVCNGDEVDIDLVSGAMGLVEDTDFEFALNSVDYKVGGSCSGGGYSSGYGPVTGGPSAGTTLSAFVASLSHDEADIVWVKLGFVARDLTDCGNDDYESVWVGVKPKPELDFVFNNPPSAFCPNANEVCNGDEVDIDLVSGAMGLVEDTDFEFALNSVDYKVGGSCSGGGYSSGYGPVTGGPSAGTTLSAFVASLSHDEADIVWVKLGFVARDLTDCGNDDYESVWVGVKPKPELDFVFNNPPSAFCPNANEVCNGDEVDIDLVSGAMGLVEDTDFEFALNSVDYKVGGSCSGGGYSSGYGPVTGGPSAGTTLSAFVASLSHDEADIVWVKLGFVARDLTDCGNDDYESVWVGVKPKPAITCPADQTVVTSNNGTGDCTASASWTNPTEENGACDPVTLTISIDGGAAETVTPGDAYNTTLEEGTHTVTYKVTDGNGNEDECSFELTVNDDEDPTFTVPADVTIYTDANCMYDPSVQHTGDVTDEADNCADNLEATFSDVITMGNCSGNLTITRTWTLDDGNGNSVSQDQIITVEDNIDPSFRLPANTTVFTDADCNYEADPSVTGEPTMVLDNCTIDPVVTYSDAIVPGACPGEFTITRTWTVTDECGNSTSGDQIINVEDDDAPVLTCRTTTIYLQAVPAGPVGQYTGAYTLTEDDVLDFSQSFDACGGDITVTNISRDDIGGTAFTCDDLGNTVSVTVTVSDCAGNLASCTATINVEQDMSLPADWQGLDIDGGSGNNYTFGDASGSGVFAPCDGQGGTFTLSSTGPSGLSMNPDQQRSALAELCGPGEFIVHVASLEVGARAGLELRESTDARSRKIALKLYRPSPTQYLLIREVRNSTGGMLQFQQFPVLANHRWLRIVRNINPYNNLQQYTLWSSGDGVTWSPVGNFWTGAVNLQLPDCIEAGLVVSGSAPNVSVSASFDGVQVIPQSALNSFVPQQNTEDTATPAGRVSVYPNPAREEATINLGAYLGQPVEIQLFTLTGRLVEHWAVDEVGVTQQRIDLQNVATGAYLIRVQPADGAPETIRLMISK